MKIERIYSTMYSILSLILIGLSWQMFFYSKPIPTAHIYIDPASSPVLFQMMDLVQLPPQEPKYIAWRRYMSHMPKNLKTALNLHYSSIKPRDSNLIYREKIKKEIKLFYSRHPNYHYIIHTNIHHLNLLKHSEILNIIPKNQIKQLNFYEDAIGWTTWSRIPRKIYFYAKNYPIQYHLTYPQYSKKKYPYLSQYFKKSDLSDIKNLSPKQKRIMFKLLNIDIGLITSYFKSKPTILLLDDCEPKILKTLPKLQKKFQQDPKLQNAVWLYKNHPRCVRRGTLYQFIQKHAKKIYEIPSKIPVEILLIAGLNPNYVFGYSSSVFFSLNRNQVLGYIKRPHDPYLSIYQEMGIVTKETIIN